MPSHLKALVRARMEKTGESYERALSHVRAEETRPSDRGATERSRTVADTAFSIAVVRAEEGARPEAERLFVDPFAAAFAEAGEHVRESTQRFVDLPFFRDGVRLRTRFIDDAVREGVASGLDQVVILGAGFDARGLRMPELARCRVFEVDTPEQLDRKRSVLAKAGVKLPGNLRYVPFDFETRDLESELGGVLAGHGFRTGAGAVFVWEGIIGYVDNATIDASLRFMARAGGARSRVVFTFADGTFDPDSAAERARRSGFASCEEVDSAELWRRHLAGEPHEHAWAIKVGVAKV